MTSGLSTAAHIRDSEVSGPDIVTTGLLVTWAPCQHRCLQLSGSPSWLHAGTTWGPFKTTDSGAQPKRVSFICCGVVSGSSVVLMLREGDVS